MSLRLLRQTPNLICNFIFGSAAHFLEFILCRRFKASLGPGNLQTKNEEVKGISAVVFEQGRRVTMPSLDCPIPPVPLLQVWEEEEVTAQLMFVKCWDFGLSL